jgi:hypothetical protein
MSKKVVAYSFQNDSLSVHKDMTGEREVDSQRLISRVEAKNKYPIAT